MSVRIETVVLDMAGTTVIDDGIVVDAFTRAWDSLHAADRRDEAVQWVRDTMGQSKIEVFRHLLPEEDAHLLNAAFEASYGDLVAEGRSEPIPGAEDTVRALRRDGRRVVFTTGFSRTTADAVLASLGWEDLADLLLTPGEVGRGRPAPDLNLTALIRTRATSVAAIAVVGDTPSDARSGVASGAGLVVGVLTGTASGDQLREAGAGDVLGSVVELPALLERHGR